MGNFQEDSIMLDFTPTYILIFHHAQKCVISMKMRKTRYLSILDIELVTALKITQVLKDCWKTIAPSLSTSLSTHHYDSYARKLMIE